MYLKFPSRVVCITTTSVTRSPGVCYICRAAHPVNFEPNFGDKALGTRVHSFCSPQKFQLCQTPGLRYVGAFRNSPASPLVSPCRSYRRLGIILALLSASRGVTRRFDLQFSLTLDAPKPGASMHNFPRANSL